MLELNNLVKRYGRVTAVDGLSLTTRPGEVLALLGPNGAGKTTTIRAVTGLAKADSGTIRVAGHDLATEPQQAKAAIGFVPDRAWFYPKVTARELLRYVASVRGLRTADGDIRSLLGQFGLSEHAERLTETYSHGMRQRLAFCVALLGQPKLLITDEPMVGLDVHGHRTVKVLFRQLASEGRTVILTTHTLGVAEEIADRVALVNRGKLVALGTVDDLRAESGRADANLEELFLLLTGDGTVHDAA